MAYQLTEFTVNGLQGTRDIQVRLKDDKLVLVGENGSGKTTLITLMFHFLSGQWHKLSQIPFERVSATVGDTSFVVSREEANFASEIGPLPPESLVHEFYDHLEGRPESRTFQYRRFAARRAKLTGLSTSSKREEFDHQLQRLAKSREALLECFNATVLFLPTYRRIEQELKSLFPDLEPDRILRRQTRRRGDIAKYVELVEFGMDDVRRHFSHSMERLKENLRQELNVLLMRYLSDILSGAHKDVDLDRIRAVPDETLSEMVDQIDEVYLPADQKTQLYEVIKGLRRGDDPSDDLQVIAHFVDKLLELHQGQQSQESRINLFVETCNQYLENIEIVFDKREFRLFVDSAHTRHESELDLSSLSSGEKQIVSLFSELMLRDNRRYYVLIDEPELSLSVEWQRRFLEDISSSGFCAGLIAVTHSPFIFENSLDSYAHSLSEFTTLRT